MIGAGLLARNAARAKGLKTEALGEDLARARQPGGRRLSRQVRACRPISTSSASTSSASAAPPASAIPARCPSRSRDAISEGDLVAAAVLSGNRNFEGRVNPDVRANYLASPPLVVAYALAGSLQIDLATEPLGIGTDGKPGLPQGHLAVVEGDRRVRPRQHHARALPLELRRRLHAATSTGGRSRSRAASPIAWNAGLDLCAEPALFRGHAAASPSRSPTSSAPASSASSSIRSPPTTSRRPARSRRRARPAPISSSTRCGRPTSTSTARAAAITK